MRINQHYRALEESYLFSTIANRVGTYQQSHPQADLIRLGIGDVTQPLCPAVLTAMQAAVAEMGDAATFRGYGPEQGYDFLRNAIRDHYAHLGVQLEADEIFVSDGAKSDIGNILDLFDTQNTVLIPDPVYPVYADTNTMAGRTIYYLDANRDNGFLPLPPSDLHGDIIYLCSPNNPTGAVYTRQQLQLWVDYAREHDAILLFDSAYEAFVGDPQLPRSIYQIPGAEECAIEFCSFSKTAGFTGTRCGYTVVPHRLVREDMSLNRMWLRRQTTKFNGVPYVVQRAAAAVFTPEGQQQTGQAIRYYLENTRCIREGLTQAGLWHVGGDHSPYVWLQCPGGMDSWDFFDLLLEQAQVVGTPGSGFGRNGQGFFRLTGFGDAQRTREAVQRILALSGSFPH